MTISYPRDLPDWLAGMVKCLFHLNYTQEQDPTGDGDPLVLDLGPVLWKADYQTPILQADKMGELEAWLDSLENGGQTFRAYDFRRPYPLAYPDGFAGMTRAGGGSFDSGTCTLGTVAADNKSVPLTDLPASFVFSAFDMLSFPNDDGSLALHRVMSAVTGDGSGAVTVEVRPHVRAGWSAGATVSLIKPPCLMRLVPDSYSPDQQARGKGTISFKAVQTVKAP